MPDISQMTFFKYIFLGDNFRISIKISLNYISEGPIDNKSTLL